MPRKKGPPAKKRSRKTKAKAPDEDEAPQDSQAQMTVQVQAEVQASPAGVASPDPDPEADAGPIDPGEAVYAADGQYILFYSFQCLLICKFCYFQISIWITI